MVDIRRAIIRMTPQEKGGVRSKLNNESLQEDGLGRYLALRHKECSLPHRLQEPSVHHMRK